MSRLYSELGDDARAHVLSSHRIDLTKGGDVWAQIPRYRPDGERQVAIWMATSELPLEYMSRLLSLGQCEEFWARPGTVPLGPNGTDWRTD